MSPDAGAQTRNDEFADVGDHVPQILLELARVLFTDSVSDTDLDGAAGNPLQNVARKSLDAIATTKQCASQGKAPRGRNADDRGQPQGLGN